MMTLTEVRLSSSATSRGFFTSKFLAAAAAFSLLFQACGGGGSAPAPQPGDSPAPEPGAPAPPAADPRPAVYLDGIYATSNAPGADPAYLLDNNPATTWRTQSGAGPDEGIMLYFSDKQQVSASAMEITPDANSFTGADAEIILYVNGQLDASGKPGARISLEPLRGGEALRSIFIRFQKTGKETSTTKKGEQGQTKIERYPKDAFVGLQQIQVFGSDGKALRLVPPRRVKGSVSATSTLEPEQAYSGANLFDARKEFVWVEDNASNSGEGEVLTFNFNAPVNVTALQIWNGYQRSESHFSANARLRNFEFGEKGGPMQTHALGDRMAGQRINLSPAAKGTAFELRIKDIFKGKKYADLAISDLVFFDGQQPFVLSTELPQQYENQTRSRVAGSPLAGILNQRVYNEEEFASLIEQKSIILRSDGTFVYYNHAMDEGIDSETLADGNWELQESSAGSAKVKVFGKLYDFALATEYYKGNSQKEVTKIFNDILTITPGEIKGQKVLGSFRIQ